MSVDKSSRGGDDMRDIFWFCLFNWTLGGALILSSVLNWRISHIRYLSESRAGKAVSRILIGTFGCVAVLIGFLLWLAPA